MQKGKVSSRVSKGKFTCRPVGVCTVCGIYVVPEAGSCLHYFFAQLVLCSLPQHNPFKGFLWSPVLPQWKGTPWCYLPLNGDTIYETSLNPLLCLAAATLSFRREFANLPDNDWLCQCVVMFPERLLIQHNVFRGFIHYKLWFGFFMRLHCFQQCLL